MSNVVVRFRAHAEPVRDCVLQGPNYGYAAVHACQGDTLTFQIQGGPHNLVEVATGEPPGMHLD